MFRITVALIVVLAGGVTGWFASTAAEPASPDRIPWATSRVVGSPDPPPPFAVARAFPMLKFDRPLLLARCPGSDRLFVGEEAGVLYSFPNDSGATADLFFDLRTELRTRHLPPDASGVETVYGLAFHPNFEANRECFVCYTLRGRNSGRNLENGTRISRFTVTPTEPPRIDPASEEIVITFPQGGHNGGDLHFGPDGLLYISTGDGSSPNPPDDLNTGQDVSDLLASILRIDVDLRVEGKNYAVPEDNPFVGREAARPEVWAYGFRNPWRMSFDRRTGELFVGDVGWELWEMIHRVEKGGNYGWAAVEGPQPIKPDQVGPTPIHPALVELPHTIACSVTGGYVYRGKKFPELYGAYVFGDWETRRVWAARFEGDRVLEMPEITRPSVRVSAFGEDNNGELYLLDYDQGTIHTLARNDGGAQNADFPTTLSQTGLFKSVEQHTPADGVTPFLINSHQWLDGATAEHWAAFPGRASVTYYANGKPIPGLVHWHNFRMHFPRDTVLLRTLSLGGTRVETQLLHYDGLDWRAYTYAWRDDQTDADLVPAEGGDKEVQIPLPLGAGPPGQNAEQTGTRVWQFQNRSQCMSCHSNQSEYALAFLPEQLNRPGPDGRNQLVALSEAGILRRGGDGGEFLPPFEEASAAHERRLVNPHDDRQPLEDRARAYLHANCGHCHSDHGGGAVPLRLQFPVAVSRMQAVGVYPTRGDFGLADAAIIEPGAPQRSTLHFRMAKFGRDRMPHLGAEWPDEAGLALIEKWIEAMDGTGHQEHDAFPPNALADRKALDRLLADPTSAQRLARHVGRGELSMGQREAVLAAAARLSAGAMRDLFEGYFPEGERGERKLGSSPRPATILALRGDALGGEELFWSQRLDCGKCHQIGERGTPVGPDLSTIGDLRPAEDLVESLISPSRRVDPAYAVYAVQTASGRTLTGLLVTRDEHTLVLRDGEGREISVAAEEMEELRPLRISLMPEGQLAGLTAQEAADLVEFLATRKVGTSISSPQESISR